MSLNNCLKFLFCSLRRGPGANIQDSAGYSALHYAALNGHTDCVRVLLTHDALPNLPDSRGSSPLHLAAWAGHQEIVKLLLTQYNRPANPNFQVNFISINRARYNLHGWLIREILFCFSFFLDY